MFDEGAITRMDTTRREIYLVFTGHEFAEGGGVIRETLRAHGAKGSFFFTGDFYRNPRFADLIRGLRDDGHYVGPHSNRHLLYAPWERRDSLLVTRKEFKDDLLGNYAAMQMFGIGLEDAPYFLPPYEWYNRTIAAWAAEMRITLVNFTPGTGSNADYTTPDMGSRYVSSDSIFFRILNYERTSTSGLNGFLLLTHVGSRARQNGQVLSSSGFPPHHPLPAWIPLQSSSRRPVALTRFCPARLLTLSTVSPVPLTRFCPVILLIFPPSYRHRELHVFHETSDRPCRSIRY